MTSPLLSAKPFDWPHFLYVWSNRMKAYGLDPAHLVTDAEVYDQHVTPDDLRLRQPQGIWWNRAKTTEHLVELNYVRIHGRPTTGYGRLSHEIELCGDGCEATRDLLCRTQNDIEANCAALCMAFFFPCFDSGRPSGLPVELEPVTDLCRDLRRHAANMLRERGLRKPWISWHTTVLPGTPKGAETNITDLDGLAEYLAEEHAASFCAYSAIRFVPVRQLNSVLALMVEQKRAALQAEEVEADRRYQEFQERTQQERQELMAARAQRLIAVNARRAQAGYPPLSDFKIWYEVTSRELKEALWSMPVTFIADEYAVSDVAVHKAAKAMKLQKPPRGFWNKVHAGTIPHPKGKPPQS